VDEPTERVKTRTVACNCIDTSQQVSRVVRVHLLAFELQEVPAARSGARISATICANM
jgi:hypothetical protein